jgi:hypothetical protein
MPLLRSGFVLVALVSLLTSGLAQKSPGGGSQGSNNANSSNSASTPTVTAEGQARVFRAIAGASMQVSKELYEWSPDNCTFIVYDPRTPQDRVAYQYFDALVVAADNVRQNLKIGTGASGGHGGLAGTNSPDQLSDVLTFAGAFASLFAGQSQTAGEAGPTAGETYLVNCIQADLTAQASTGEKAGTKNIAVYYPAVMPLDVVRVTVGSVDSDKTDEKVNPVSRVLGEMSAIDKDAALIESDLLSRQEAYLVDLEALQVAASKSSDKATKDNGANIQVALGKLPAGIGTVQPSGQVTPLPSNFLGVCKAYVYALSIGPDGTVVKLAQNAIDDEKTLGGLATSGAIIQLQTIFHQFVQWLMQAQQTNNTNPSNPNNQQSQTQQPQNQTNPGTPPAGSSEAPIAGILRAWATNKLISDTSSRAFVLKLELNSSAATDVNYTYSYLKPSHRASASAVVGFTIYGKKTDPKVRGVIADSGTVEAYLPFTLDAGTLNGTERVQVVMLHPWLDPRDVPENGGSEQKKGGS